MTPEMEADLQRSLGSIGATLERIEQNLQDHKKLTKKEIDLLAVRVRQVEGKINWGAGAVAVLGSIAALVYGGWHR